jgi:glutathione S-transferase
MLTVFGTTTSPFVRRVRLVAHRLGIAHELVDTSDPAGQARLREASPIWKVPTAIWRGAVVLDSHAITETLLADAGGNHGIAPWDPLDHHTRNLMTVIDGATDALINRFYLMKDGVPETTPYVRKQYERAAAAFAWLDGPLAERARAVRAAPTAPANALGLLDIAVVTSVEWIRFRATYPIDQHPGITAFVDAVADRAHPWHEAFAQTSPRG